MANQNHRNRVRGTAHHRAKLTPTKVRIMRKLYNKGMCIRCLSLFYRVRYGTAWDAVSYVTWKQVSD